METKPEAATAGRCPVMHTKAARSSRDWWPGRLDVDVLHHHSSRSDPMGGTSITRRRSRASISTR